MKSPPHTRHRAALAALVIALIVAAVAFSSGGVSSQESDPQQRDLERVFRQHDRLSLDPGQIARQVKQTRSLTLTTSRGTFEMTLEPHDMRAPGYVAEAWGDNGVRVLERTPVRTYKGTVRGLPTAQARMTIDEENVEGLIITPGELFFLEPTKRYSRTAAKTDFVFYAGSELKESAGECGTTMAQMVAQHSANVSNQTSTKGPQPEAVFGPALEIGIAAEADFEYFTQLGSSETAARQQIETIMFEVEGIYNVQMGLQFNFSLTNLRVWTTASDPYTSPVAPATTVDAGDALEEFQDYYNANAPAQAAGRDIAHLWTGRDIRAPGGGNTIGIAFQPGMECPLRAQGFAYGISEHLPTGNRAGLTAHEIGHNLNASHVTSANGSDCGDPGSTTTTSIMNARISSSMNFCQFSRDEITNHAISTRTCLDPITQPGCTYSISPPSQNIPANGGGSSVTVTTTAGCNWAVAEGVNWLTVTSGASGSGPGAMSYSVSGNSCGPRTALMSIGGQILSVQQAATPNYLFDLATATPLVPGQTTNGHLLPDCRTGLADRENAFMDRYKFNGMAGQKIRIEMNSAIPAEQGGVDTYLYLIAPNGNIVNENDDLWLGEQRNSRIPCTNVPTGPCAVEFYPLPQTGTYIIIATSFRSGETGAYSLTLTSEPLLLTAQGSGSAAAALNSMTFARTSNAENTAFRIFDPYNFSADQTTRLILFTSDLGLAQQQNPSSSDVSVAAGGRQLTVENVGPFTFPGLSGSYVIVSLGALNNNPPLQGSLAFTVTSRGLTSNVTSITIVP